MAMVFKGDPIISKVVSREDGKEESQFCSNLLFYTKAYGLCKEKKNPYQSFDMHMDFFLP